MKNITNRNIWIKARTRIIKHSKKSINYLINTLINDDDQLSWKIIGTGCVILLVGLLALLSEQVQLDTAAKFGDFMGGVVGALWTLAGVLLLWSTLKVQRSELEKYKEELKSQRIELASSRATDVTYRQISLLNSVEINTGETTYKGKLAIELASFIATEARNLRETVQPSNQKALTTFLNNPQTSAYFNDVTNLIAIIDHQSKSLKEGLSNATNKTHESSLKNILINNLPEDFPAICNNLIRYFGFMIASGTCTSNNSLLLPLIESTLKKYEEFIPS